MNDRTRAIAKFVLRMTGLHHLNLGYGCMDPQQMENLAVEAFSKMHHLVHFSLKKYFLKISNKNVTFSQNLF